LSTQATKDVRKSVCPVQLN